MMQKNSLFKGGGWRKLLHIFASFTLLTLVSHYQNKEFVSDPSLSKKKALIIAVDHKKASPQLLVAKNEPKYVGAWDELFRLKLSSPAQDLLKSLTADEFQDLKPFMILSDLSGLKEVVATDMISFKREVFRSPQFQLSTGYDTVKYEVLHIDGRKSHIFAYKQKTAADQVAIGMSVDLRPTFILLVIEGEDQSYATAYLFENGQLKTQGKTDSKSALIDIESWIEKSTPFVAQN